MRPVKRIKQYTKRFLSIFRKQLIKHIQVECNVVRYGNEDYGAWAVCIDDLNSDSVVYSFGVGEDASWDFALIDAHAVNIFAFDPTPKSIHWVENQILPEKFIFEPIGIADFDGTLTFFPPQNEDWASYTLVQREKTVGDVIEGLVKRLETIANDKGHQVIDILKIDIEGAEYAVIRDILNSDNIQVKQILVEFHHHFDEIDTSATIDAIHLLNKNGYKIFAISPDGYDYCFIKK